MNTQEAGRIVKAISRSLKTSANKLPLSKANRPSITGTVPMNRCKFLSYHFRLQMRVSEEHSSVLVAADEGYFWNAQSVLEEAANGFVTQIMEPEVLDAHSTLETLPSESYGVR